MTSSKKAKSADPPAAITIEVVVSNPAHGQQYVLTMRECSACGVAMADNEAASATHFEWHAYIEAALSELRQAGITIAKAAAGALVDLERRQG